MTHENNDILNKITELFIASGYSRARIPTLSNLDKILGGITWALTSCFYDVEFEFKDEMNIGEKIRVSEKIIKALKSAGCPIIINPVQIQGLDYDIIFQVVQWLVKFLHETRDERVESTQRYAYGYASLVLNKKENSNKLEKSMIEAINNTKYELISEGRQMRINKKISNLSYTEELKIYLTLCEFDMNKDLKFQKELLELLKTKNLIHS